MPVLKDNPYLTADENRAYWANGGTAMFMAVSDEVAKTAQTLEEYEELLDQEMVRIGEQNPYFRYRYPDHLLPLQETRRSSLTNKKEKTSSPMDSLASLAIVMGLGRGNNVKSNDMLPKEAVRTSSRRSIVARLLGGIVATGALVSFGQRPKQASAYIAGCNCTQANYYESCVPRSWYACGGLGLVPGCHSDRSTYYRYNYTPDPSVYPCDYCGQEWVRSYNGGC